MEGDNRKIVYQLRVWLREISPAIWRRLLVRSDSPIADLHHTIQIAMGWTDFHLHQFIIHGKRYGVFSGRRIYVGFPKVFGNLDFLWFWGYNIHRN